MAFNVRLASADPRVSVAVPSAFVTAPAPVPTTLNNWPFQNRFTVVAGLVFAVFVPSVTSVAVTVRLPALLKVTEKVCVPATSAAFAGNVARVSLDVIRIV
jgi:hypothetical protein